MNVVSLSWVLAAVAQVGASGNSGGLTLMDAVKQALAANPDINIQRAELLSNRGAVGVANAQFDWYLDSTLSHQRVHTIFTEDQTLADDVTQFRVGVSKQFGWGMTVSPNITLQRTPRSFLTNTGTSAGQNIATVSVQITQPILRGFGAATSAQRDAAEIFLKAGGHELQHVISQRVYNTAIAYWEYWLAMKSAEIFQGAEARAQQILNDGKSLVAADERPKADLEQLEANHADRMRSRFDAEQALYEAKVALALLMGVSAEEIAKLPAPSTPILAIPADFPVPPNQLVASAIERRQDLRSAQLRMSAAETLFAAAENKLYPQLDVFGELGYGGIVAGRGAGDFFAPVANNVPGPNFRVGLALQWPVTNAGSDGELMQAQATLRQTELARDELKRRIAASVLVSVELLKTAIRTGDRAKKAAVHYRSAVENERTKLKSGLSTIIDVVLTEDRMTSSLIGEITTQARYAESVVRLGFETGRLTEPDGESATIALDRLVSAAP